MQIKNYVFFRSGHPLAKKAVITLKDLEEYPFVTYDQGMESSYFSEEPLFYKILNKNVHVSDRCTKIALVRRTDCFSIGPDLTNSNADNFHRGLGEILAKPLADPPGNLRLGCLLKNGSRVSPMGMSYLAFLEEDIRTINEEQQDC